MQENQKMMAIRFIEIHFYHKIRSTLMFFIFQSATEDYKSLYLASSK